MSLPYPVVSVLALIISSLIAVAGKEGDNSLKGTDPIFTGPQSGQFTVASPRAKLTWLPGTDAPGPQTLQITVDGPAPAHDRGDQISYTLDTAFNVGDIVVLSFKVRCPHSESDNGLGRISPLVEVDEPPYKKFIWSRHGFEVGPEWQTLTLKGRVTRRDYAAGRVILKFRLGYPAQTLEIKDIKLWLLPEATDFYAVPSTEPPLYSGHEKDAAWRQAAQQRIDKYRKQDVQIQVVDNDGNPVPEATVRLEQTRHAFGFGTAIAVKYLIGTGDAADRAMYQSVLLHNFDTCGTENDLKWPGWEMHREKTLQGLEWLKERGFDQMRGHVLLWPSFVDRRTPGWLQQYADDPVKLRSVILEHVQDILTATAPYVQEWDVINEPRNNHQILDILGGRSFMLEVFDEARKWLPEGRLFLNEALTLTADSRMDAFEETARYLLDEGAPLDGLGVQCHYGAWEVTPPEQILSTLDRLAKLGVDIEVTEFDLASPSDTFRARYLRDFYTAVFSHPAVTGIQMWGFWAGRHWLPDAAPWAENWNIRPSGQAYLDLVRGEWWTQESGQTDSTGAWTTRGFKGQYRVTILIGETVVNVRELTLGETPAQVQIKL